MNANNNEIVHSSLFFDSNKHLPLPTYYCFDRKLIWSCFVFYFLIDECSDYIFLRIWRCGSSRKKSICGVDRCQKQWNNCEGKQPWTHSHKRSDCCFALKNNESTKLLYFLLPQCFVWLCKRWEWLLSSLFRLHILFDCYCLFGYVHFKIKLQILTFLHICVTYWFKFLIHKVIIRGLCERPKLHK